MSSTGCIQNECYKVETCNLENCWQIRPELQFHKLTMADQQRLEPYFALRPNKICDSSFLDIFLWSQSNQLEYCLVEEEAVLWKMDMDGEVYTIMPSCREEDLPYYFDLIQNYFNRELKCPVKIFWADEEAIEVLKLRHNPYYRISEQEDLKDYLYDAEKLKTLSGRSYHKKKNLVNKFKKLYEGRWEYRSLTNQDTEQIKGFLENWYSVYGTEEGLETEKEGIWTILNSPIIPEIRMGAVLIDGEIEAFTMGNYNELEEMAIICVEKANTQIPGLYQAINQQFIEQEFSQARLVNREDDVGMEGLRKAKLSYNPIGYAKKYTVTQSLF